jgi:hypothetical protein
VRIERSGDMGEGGGDPDGARDTAFGRKGIDARHEIRPKPQSDHDGPEMIRSARTTASHANSRP